MQRKNMKNDRILREPITTNPNITVKNLGPIKNATINVGDLTALIGLPNSGKSYLLRSVYWYLQLLDEKAYLRVLEETKGAPGSQTFKFIELKADGESFTVKTLKYVVNIFETMYRFSKDAIQQKVKESSNIENLVEEFMRISSLSDPVEINYTLDAKILKKDLKNRIQSAFNSSLISLTGTTDIDSISVSGKTIDVILDESIEAVTLTNDEEIEKTIIPYHPHLSFGRLNDRNDYFAERNLRNLPFKLKLCVSINQIDKETMKCDIKATMELDKERFTQRFINILDFASFDRYSLYRRYIQKRRPEIDSEIFNAEMDVQILEMAIEMASDNILNKCLLEMRSNIETIANIKSVKFLPYGRNAMIQFQGYANKRGARGENNVVEILKDIKAVPYLSYFHWLIESRAKLSDAQGDLKDIFSLIMGGQILNSDDNASIGFSYQKGKSVDIGLSSAMVEELTGILLPTLVADEGELLIIEEPEAQLHVRVQIMMGLLLVSISKLKKLKILFSTHSDLLALTIAYISEIKPSDTALNELVKSIMSDLVTDEKKLKHLTKIIYNSLNQVNSKTYYLESGKDSRELNPSEIKNSIPSISNTVDSFYDWVFKEKGRIYEENNLKTHASKKGDVD